MILNRASVERLKYACDLYGFNCTSNNFNAGQDVGMGLFDCFPMISSWWICNNNTTNKSFFAGIYAWLFGLYHLRIPGVAVTVGNKLSIPEDHMMVHAMKHKHDHDNCEEMQLWKHAAGSILLDRYDQKFAVGQ